MNCSPITWCDSSACWHCSFRQRRRYSASPRSSSESASCLGAVPDGSWVRLCPLPAATMRCMASALRFFLQFCEAQGERSETGGYTVFIFVYVCLSVCLCVRAHSVPLVWIGGMAYRSARNVFDSCVKSWHYFRTDKILLETPFYWLSGDVVRFKIEVRF